MIYISIIQTTEIVVNICSDDISDLKNFSATITVQYVGSTHSTLQPSVDLKLQPFQYFLI